MKIAYSQIQSFLPIELPETQVAEILTLLGLEVDAVENGVFEISLTPNLGHCMSALGVARELAAFLQKKVNAPSVTLSEMPLNKKIRIQDPSLCPRYSCALIEGVHGKPIVDTLNEIMMLIGQPMHAFDADLLEGDVLEIAPAKEEMSILCLDDVERKVPPGALLIWDAKKPVAIAGVMGAANSAVSENTKTILVEAAQFSPLSIRKTARQIDCRTESAQRFEKGVDPLLPMKALSMALEKLKGTVRGCVDLTQKAFEPKVIAYRVERINRLLGTCLSKTEIEELFERLEMICQDGTVQIPSYRLDLNEEIDLVEEVARIYGYNNIEKRAPKYSTCAMAHDPMFLFERKMRRALASLGLTEFSHADLISPKLAELCTHITPSSMEFFRVKHAKSEEYSTLRTSLLPALLQSAKTNHDQKNFSIAAFEIGRIHFASEGKPIEIPMAAILLSGPLDPLHWSGKSRNVDFFDLKGMIETLCSAQFCPSQHIAMHPGRQADICHNDLILGSLGEIHPSILKAFDIGERVYYAEFNLYSLMKLQTHGKLCKELTLFPASERDWTVSLHLQAPIGHLLEQTRHIQSPLLEKAELIDLYEPANAKEKNATLRFTYRDPHKTVSYEEVEKEHMRVISALQTKILAR